MANEVSAAIDRVPFPRPCEIHSHQFYLRALCLDIINGVALVETEDGTVSRYDLTGVYSLKFTDR